MEITKGSDLILILKLEDYKNEKMRVDECADFRLYVWTANRNNFLEFTKREITQDEKVDKISIPDFMINCLESGVICYQYMYSKKSDDFAHTDSHYDKSKVVVTDIYWRNTNLNEEPKNPVNYQTLNYLRDLIENEALTREKQIYDLKKFVDTDFMEKLNSEIKRSNEVDIEFHKLINKNHSECVNTSTELNEKLDAEIKRSTEKDAELLNLINSNKSDSADQSTALEAKLDAEIARSKQADSDHTNAEITLQTKLDNEVERAKTAEGAIRDAVENERDRAIAKETLISDTLTSKLDTEIERAKDREEHINDDLHDEITRAKAEEKRIEDLITSNSNKDSDLSDKLTAEIDRAKQAEKDLNSTLTDEIKRSTDKDAEFSGLIADLSTSIANEVKRSTDADTAITGALNDVESDLTKEVSRAKAEEGRIEAKVDTNTSNLNSEIARAKQVEADITTSLQQLKNSVSTKNSEVTEAIEDLQSDVKANADAIAVINGDSSVIGSIEHSLYHAEHYTDDKIDELEEKIDNKTSFILESYATKTEVDNRIKGVIGTAPEALDTLGEIATVLNGNGDAITAINGVLAGKANSSEVYTKSETDGRIKNVNDAITAEADRAKIKETDLNTAITSEIGRAKAAEKLNADAIAVINGSASTIGSLAHTLEDSKHYTDDEIAKFNGKYYTKSEVDNAIANVEVDLTDYYDRAEVNDLLDGYATKKAVADCVTEIGNLKEFKADKSALDSYAKKAETTCIKDENGKVITEMVIDNSTADDSVEVYTKEQCDERFAKVWSGSEAQYNAITNKDNNTIYIIL